VDVQLVNQVANDIQYEVIIMMEFDVVGPAMIMCGLNSVSKSM